MKDNDDLIIKAIYRKRIHRKDEPRMLIYYTYGLKITRERIAIIEILQKSDRPISANEIVENLKDSGVNRATIFRTIKALEKVKIIKKVLPHKILSKRSAYYEIY
jgi:Fe2+ or Zn2+ uptake regulation protein